MTAAVYVCAALLVALIATSTAEGSPRPAKPGEMVKLWNRFCASVLTQNEALQALNTSLRTLHPDRVTDARRLELYTRSILESERQAALLRAMRKAEFGRAGEGKSADPPGLGL